MTQHQHWRKEDPNQGLHCWPRERIIHPRIPLATEIQPDYRLENWKNPISK